MNTPILLLLFNRPEKTRQVFEQVRRQQPAYLYLAADGPRPDVETDKALCLEAREILNHIDWPCQVKTLFRDKNLGCKQAVSGALDWFFEQEEMGIILEDDLVIDPSFFQFCTELLLKYKDDPNVVTIGGNNFQCGQKRGNASYYFSNILEVWGWATWRRSWKQNNNQLQGIELPGIVPVFLKYSSGRKLFARSMGDIFLSCKPASQYCWKSPMALTNLSCKFSDHAKATISSISSWAYPFWFSLVWQAFVENRQCLHIVPQVNLVQNKGFDQESTHTKQLDSFLCVKASRCEYPVTHPEYVQVHREADLFSEMHEHKITCYYQIKRNFYYCYPKLTKLILQIKQYGRKIIRTNTA